MLQFHIAFMTQYPDCATPKLHLCRHIPEALKEHKLNMSCASGERLHRRTKDFGRFAFRQFEHTMLNRTLTHQLEDLQKPRMFLQHEMEGRERRTMVNGIAYRSWQRARFGLIKVMSGDVLYWTEGAHRHFARCISILESGGHAYVHSHPLSSVADADAEFTVSGDYNWLDCALVAGTLMHIESAGKLRVLMPA